MAPRSPVSSGIIRSSHPTINRGSAVPFVPNHSPDGLQAKADSPKSKGGVTCDAHATLHCWIAVPPSHRHCSQARVSSNARCTASRTSHGGTQNPPAYSQRRSTPSQSPSRPFGRLKPLEAGADSRHGHVVDQQLPYLSEASPTNGSASNAPGNRALHHSRRTTVPGLWP